MKNLSFEQYWREFGKLHPEVINNPPELEDDFKSLCKKIWAESNYYTTLEKNEEINGLELELERLRKESGLYD